MSSNEYIDKESAQHLSNGSEAKDGQANHLDDSPASSSKSSKNRSKRSAKKGANKKSAEKSNGRLVVQILNGEFLSKDWFVRNLPFTFYVGFLLVLLIGWGYFGESTTRKEVQLQVELNELNSEYFTLSSEYISKRGRTQIKEKLQGTGLEESRVSPKKIRVRRYVFR